MWRHYFCVCVCVCDFYHKKQYVHAWTWKSLTHVLLFSTPWTPFHTVHGILQARILEWVAIPFSRGSSQPRDWTQVSCLAGRFFTSWATREAQGYWRGWPIPSWTGVSCIAGGFFTDWVVREALFACLVGLNSKHPMPNPLLFCG